MRPLFQKLLTQQKPEDFFTEIVAALFREEEVLLKTWLSEKLELKGIYPESRVTVKTQHHFLKLDDQSLDSRVDLVLDLRHEGVNVLVFIESKVGSGAGTTQIERYAGHISNHEKYAHKYLLYITRDYVPQDELSGYEKTARDLGIKFKAIRWFELHRYLQTHKSSFIITETQKFMEANRMNQKATFEKEDVHTLTNLQSAIDLMEETLFSKVREEFQKTIGTVNRSSKSSLSQVIGSNRYVIYGWMQERWWCYTGYQLGGTDEDDYPRVMVNLEVAPKSSRADDIAETLLSISEQETEWKFYNVSEWRGISNSKLLTDLLAGPDHVSRIKQFFLDSLKEIESFKRFHKNLPWQSSSEDWT